MRLADSEHDTVRRSECAERLTERGVPVVMTVPAAGCSKSIVAARADAGADSASPATPQGPGVRLSPPRRLPAYSRRGRSWGELMPPDDVSVVQLPPSTRRR